MSREHKHGIQRKLKWQIYEEMLNSSSNKTRYNLNPIKLAKIKSLGMPGTDENIEKLELTYFYR